MLNTIYKLIIKTQYTMGKVKVINGKNNTKLVLGYDYDDIIQLLKLQIPVEIISVTTDGQTRLGGMKIGSRGLKNGIQQVQAIFNGEKSATIRTYDEVAKELWDMLSEGMPVVVFNTADFNRKKELIDLIGFIKQDIIKGCAFIDWNDDMLSIISKPKPNNPNKMYFWPKLKTLFVFGEQPNLLFNVDKFKSIQDLLV